MDDELYCDVKECPDECFCIGAFFNCTSAKMSNIAGHNMQAFIGNNNRISISPSSLSQNPFVIVLVLRSNNISTLSLRFDIVPFLHFLDLGNNCITYIGPQVFTNLQYLVTLCLDSNPVVYLEGTHFTGLDTLKNINLSNTFIKQLSFQSFLMSVTNLVRLDISRNNLVISKAVETVPLTNIMIHIRSDSWHFCCIARYLTYCDTVIAPLSGTDCHSLITSMFLKVAVWVVAISSVGLNMVAIVYHLSLLRRHQGPKHLILAGLALCDVMTGCYLFALVAADALMHGTYVRYDTTWKETITCLCMACLQNFGMEGSLVSLVCLSMLQMLVIVYHRKPTVRKTSIVISSVWLCFVFVSLIPVMFRINVEVNICVFSIKSYTLDAMMVYNGVLHLGVNVILLVASVALCAKIIHKIHYTRQCIKELSNAMSKSTQHTFALLIMQAICRIICWFPIQILLIAGLFGMQISPELMPWTIVMLMALNSLVNPVLYTFRTIRRKK